MLKNGTSEKRRYEKMSDKKITANFPICGLLGIAFIVLKLCKVISWNWLWVLCPFWAPIALGIVAIIIYTVFKLLTDYLPEHIENKKRLKHSWIEEQALDHKDKWRAGPPEKEGCIVFKINGKWHNGYYEKGAFRIVGTNESFDTVDVWYYP